MLFALIIIGVVVLDQVSKAIVVANMDMGESIRFIPYIIRLCRTENTGMAWGMFENNRWVFLILSTVAIIGFGFFYYKTKKPHILFTISMGFILGGGIGNMIDRIFRAGVNPEGINAVVDFLQFDFFKSFPIFNIADSFVTVGTVIMLVYIMFIDGKQEHPLLFDKKSKKTDE